jgi:uncharacterized protein (TIGR03790 family)
MKALRTAGWVVALMVALGRSAAAGPETGQLVILANRNVPASLELARYYAAARQIPDGRICELDLPDTETMSRRDYEQRLRDPLLAFLRARRLIDQVRRNPRHVAEHDSGWHTVNWSVRYLLPLYGVPLRIDDTKPELLEKVEARLSHGAARDEAAVDSELVLALLDGHELRGRFGNPLHGQLAWPEPADGNPPLLLVTRLDGPSPEVVRRMIDGALEAERSGLHGRFYFDMRSPQDDDYRLGDYWLAEALERFRREGFECVADRQDAVLGSLHPLDDAALYMGWYAEAVTGPFARTNFSFRPGAFAYHNHSGNAKSLRTADQHWAGPLLARGAAVTMGAVSEPFLNFTPSLHILADRLCNGLNLAESTHLAMPVFSWQEIVLGDPLYRPFARTLDEQLKTLQEERRPELAWAQLRKVNLLVREGRFNVALAYCREALRAGESRILREKLADLYAMNELYEDADQHYARALQHAETDEIAVRIGLRYLLMLRLLKKDEHAAEVEKTLRERWPDSPYLTLLDKSQP